MEFDAYNYLTEKFELLATSNQETSKLASIIELLIDENARFSSWMHQQQQQIHQTDTKMTEMYGEDVTKTMSRHAFLQHHQNTLTVVIGQLRDLSVSVWYNSIRSNLNLKLFFNSCRIIAQYRPYCLIQAHHIVSHRLFQVQRTHTNHLLLRVSIVSSHLLQFLSIIPIQLKVRKSISPI